MPKMMETLVAGTAPVTHVRLPDPPRLVPLPDGPRTFGPSRSTWYRLEKEGKVRLVKLGRSTFIDTASALEFLAGLPSVTPKQAA